MKKNKKNEIKQQFNRELKIALVSVVAFFVLAAGAFFFFNNKSPDTSVEKKDGLTRDFNHKTGPDSAKVKIVEFFDPECEACAAFSPYIKEALARYGDKVQLTVRYTLFHGNSELAAKASEAAATQGKFWDFHELLFLNQHEWSHKQMPATEYFIKYAKDLGLNVEKFKADMNDMRIMDNISADIADGKRLGVQATPTIFINGKELQNLSPRGLIEMIEGQL